MWIIMAWQLSSPELTVKSFKKCCISYEMDGDGDMLWNGNEKDENVRSECEEDEGTECEDKTLIGKVKYNLTCYVY
jgi:hypothetical protein